MKIAIGNDHSCHLFFPLEDFTKQLPYEPPSLAFPTRVRCPICLTILHFIKLF